MAQFEALKKKFIAETFPQTLTFSCVCGAPLRQMHPTAGFDGYAAARCGALVPYNPGSGMPYGGPAFSAPVCHGDACAAPGGAPVPHDTVQGVASVGTVYDKTKAHNDLQFMNVRTRNFLSFHHCLILYMVNSDMNSYVHAS